MTGPAQRFGSTPRACPFVALDDDRDRRAQAPDPRHRCYAVPTPEPRALAHQEAYCLAPAFSSCSFFLDWAGRAAAEPTIPAAAPASSGAPASPPPDVVDRPWTAGPAWSGDGSADDRFDPPTAEPGQLGVFPEPPAAPDRNLGGADLPLPAWTPDAPAIVGRRPERPASAFGAPPIAPTAGPQTWSKPSGVPASAFDDLPPSPESDQAARFSGRPITIGSPGRVPPQARPPAKGTDESAEWAQPRRFAAYPTLRGRTRVSPILIGFFALLIGALLLFLLPSFLSGGSGKTPKPSSQPTPTQNLAPTPTPAPTPIVYTVKPKDTLSAIAKSFGVTADQIACFNGLKSVNVIAIGQQLNIPPATYVCPPKGSGRVTPPPTTAPST